MSATITKGSRDTSVRFKYQPSSRRLAMLPTDVSTPTEAAIFGYAAGQYEVEFAEAMKRFEEHQRDSIRYFVSVIASPVDELFAGIESLVSSGRIHPAIRLVFNTMNGWLCSNRFDYCRTALERANVDSIGTDAAVAFLTITFAANGFLGDSRAKLHRRIFNKLAKSIGPVEAARVLPRLS
jgi:hypothetical protein